MREYSFNALCKSGEWKLFTCTAANFTEARKLLDQFVAAN